MANASVDHLKNIVERLQNLMAERDGINEDIRSVVSFAKSIGFDAPAIRACLKALASDTAARIEGEEIELTYRRALGIEGPRSEIELPEVIDGGARQQRKIGAKEKRVREILALSAAAQPQQKMIGSATRG